MNNILKISLTVLFAISTVFSAVGGAKTTQGKKAQSDGGNFSYLTVVLIITFLVSLYFLYKVTSNTNN